MLSKASALHPQWKTETKKAPKNQGLFFLSISLLNNPWHRKDQGPFAVNGLAFFAETAFEPEKHA